MNSAIVFNRFGTQYFVMTLILCSGLILLGCSNPLTLDENKVSFDGYYFPYKLVRDKVCLLYTSPSPRDRTRSRMPSSA